MEEGKIQLIGNCIGQHGPYTFYKGLKHFKEEKWKILGLGEFFFLKISNKDPICIGELQLLWQDRSHNGQLMSSSRLYFLPEDTPYGRSDYHGEDEVLAVSEKVVIQIEDLIAWTCSGKNWKYGSSTPQSLVDVKENCKTKCLKDMFVLNSGLNADDQKQEERISDDASSSNEISPLVLSYPKYCRYKALLKRMENSSENLANNELMSALGAQTVPSANTRMMFCRQTFSHPTLLTHEKLCDHLAPNLKGRPRKKKLTIKELLKLEHLGNNSNNLEHHQQIYLKSLLPDGIKDPSQLDEDSSTYEEDRFLSSLYRFMNEHKKPIERIPYLGFKRIDLFQFYKLTQKYGGYELVGSKKLWKHIYDKLGGNPGSTSAATCTRRHYERLLLPYELYTNGKAVKRSPAKPYKLLKLQQSKEMDINTNSHKKINGIIEDEVNPAGKNEADNPDHVNNVMVKAEIGDLTSEKRNICKNFSATPDKGISSKSTNSEIATKPLSASIMSPLAKKKMVAKIPYCDREEDALPPPPLPPPPVSTEIVTNCHSGPVTEELPALRPSVIQHTQTVNSSPPLSLPLGYLENKMTYNKIEPGDLILRKFTQQQKHAMQESSSTPPIAHSKDYKNHKYSYLAQENIGLSSEYFPYYLPASSYVSETRDTEKKPNGLKRLSSGQHSPDSSRNSQYFTKRFKNFLGEQKPTMTESSTFAHSLPLYASYLEQQEEPTDLSLPKKNRSDSNSDSVQSRTIDSDKAEVVANKTFTSNVESEGSVKSQPTEARGSILQGIIDVSKANLESLGRAAASEKMDTSEELRPSPPSLLMADHQQQQQQRLPQAASLSHVLIPDYCPPVPTLSSLDKGGLLPMFNPQFMYPPGVLPYMPYMGVPHIFTTDALPPSSLANGYEEMIHTSGGSLLPSFSGSLGPLHPHSTYVAGSQLIKEHPYLYRN